MSAAIVIPARYASTRYPGKPLIEIKGKSLIQRVWEKCAEALEPQHVYVATDDDKIAAHCKQNGMQVLMTSSTCLTGTDRVYEASQQLKYDMIINVQGDEPLVTPEDIRKILAVSIRQKSAVVCGMTQISEESDFRSPTVPKVVCNLNGELMYMSRAAIPTSKAFAFKQAHKQVCIYGFPPDLLKVFYKYGRKTPVEEIEDIEILRFVELGHKVQMVPLSTTAIAVDTPEDVTRVVEFLDRHGLE